MSAMGGPWLQALAGHHVALSAVPYYFNLPLTRAAIAAGVSFCDLGGNTEIVRQQHGLDAEARAAGVAVVADCGMGPGMGNNLAVYAMGLLDQPQQVMIYDAGLPQAPEPPWNYLATFNIEGLINEYYGGMTVLRGGPDRPLALLQRAGDDPRAGRRPPGGLRAGRRRLHRAVDLPGPAPEL
jgi:lysine 6-dehydrogenase